MKSFLTKLTIFLLLFALLVSCSGQETSDIPTAEEPAVEETLINETIPAVEEQPTAEEMPAEAGPAEEAEGSAEPADGSAEAPAAPTPQAAAETITLTKQPYVSPSNAFTVNFPENWNCSETGKYRVDCHNLSNTSEVIVRVTATGYELVQDDFLAMARAEIVSDYTDVKAYIQVSEDESEGVLVNEATWRVGDVYWQGIDHFVRSDAAVYQFSFASVRDQLEQYRPAFNEILQRAILNPSAMSGAPLYAFRKEFVPSGKIFNLQVPTSWSKFADSASIDRTTVEGFTSPDGRAGVQVAVFAKGSNISQETKGVKTLEIIRKLYGWDLRVPKGKDTALQDGRERLEWYGTMKDVQGITYFDSSGTSLYIFSVIWEPATADLYTPILQEVIDSFTYEE